MATVSIHGVFHPRAGVGSLLLAAAAQTKTPLMTAETPRVHDGVLFQETRRRRRLQATWRGW
jgi:hypothetical protein